jgi:hypothetical protein
MITASQFAPPDLRSAAQMIHNYGVENGLTSEQLLDVFHAGLATVASDKSCSELGKKLLALVQQTR